MSSQDVNVQELHTRKVTTKTLNGMQFCASLHLNATDKTYFPPLATLQILPIVVKYEFFCSTKKVKLQPSFFSKKRVIFYRKCYFFSPSNGCIHDLGRDADIENRYANLSSLVKKTIDVTGKVVIPGLVDGHTHPVWDGDRVHEFALKVRYN